MTTYEISLVPPSRDRFSFPSVVVDDNECLLYFPNNKGRMICPSKLEGIAANFNSFNRDDDGDLTVESSEL